eukprot:Hpha_TRINITY_DN16267_c4_g3::TRINITY_DN16267_c4_g3_i1::g.13512::m.13512
MWRLRGTFALAARSCGSVPHRPPLLQNGNGNSPWAPNGLSTTGGDSFGGIPVSELQSEYSDLADLQGAWLGDADDTAADGQAAQEEEGGLDKNDLPENAQARVVVNGMIAIACPLPEAGVKRSEIITPGPELNVMGDTGGTSLDVFFEAAAPGHSLGKERLWTGRLLVTCDGKEHVVQLGVVGGGDHASSTHVGTFVSGPAITGLSFEVTVLEANADRRTPQEMMLIDDVVAILEDARVNPFGGSVASVLVSNKAKESAVFEGVIQKQYAGSWPNFVRAHRDTLRLFKYTEEEARDYQFTAPMRPLEPRIALVSQDKDVVLQADVKMANQAKGQEAVIRDFIVKLLEDGKLCQTVVLEQLKECPEFCASITPAAHLLQRFLARHSDVFVWNASPDMPMRIGLATDGRYPHRLKLTDYHSQPGNTERMVSQVDRVWSAPAEDVPTIAFTSSYSLGDASSAYSFGESTDLSHYKDAYSFGAWGQESGQSWQGQYFCPAPEQTCNKYRHDPYSEYGWLSLDSPTPRTSAPPLGAAPAAAVAG